MKLLVEVIVEGAGHWQLPLSDAQFAADLIELLHKYGIAAELLQVPGDEVK